MEIDKGTILYIYKQLEKIYSEIKTKENYEEATYEIRKLMDNLQEMGLKNQNERKELYEKVVSIFTALLTAFPLKIYLSVKIKKSTIEKK